MATNSGVDLIIRGRDESGPAFQSAMRRLSAVRNALATAPVTNIGRAINVQIREQGESIASLGEAIRARYANLAEDVRDHADDLGPRTAKSFASSGEVAGGAFVDGFASRSGRGGLAGAFRQGLERVAFKALGIQAADRLLRNFGDAITASDSTESLARNIGGALEKTTESTLLIGAAYRLGKSIGEHLGDVIAENIDPRGDRSRRGMLGEFAPGQEAIDRLRAQREQLQDAMLPDREREEKQHKAMLDRLSAEAVARGASQEQVRKEADAVDAAWRAARAQRDQQAAAEARLRGEREDEDRRRREADDRDSYRRQKDAEAAELERKRIGVVTEALGRMRQEREANIRAAQGLAAAEERGQVAILARRFRDRQVAAASSQASGPLGLARDSAAVKNTLDQMLRESREQTEAINKLVEKFPTSVGALVTL